jgi:undecaprenyl-diphosphatase
MNTTIVIIAKYLIYLLILLVVLFAALRVTRDEFKSLVLRYIVGVVVALIMVKLAGIIYYNPRPFVDSGIPPLIPHSPTNGFPSNHTVAAALMALLLWTYSKRIALVLFIVAVAIGLARVLANVHHLEDIIAGIFIAIIAAIFSNLTIHYTADRKATAPDN